MSYYWGRQESAKTELSLRVAEHFGSPIISSDSRQLYKDLPIGTAAPTVEQMARVRHYMVGTLSLTDYYSASSFEEDVMSLLRELHQTYPTVVMTGGSMMYIDAVTKGIDDIPTVTPEIRPPSTSNLKKRVSHLSLPS